MSDPLLLVIVVGGIRLMYGVISMWLARRQPLSGPTVVVLLQIGERTVHKGDVLDRAARCSCRRES